jgi:hypothetical protein
MKNYKIRNIKKNILIIKIKLIEYIYLNNFFSIKIKLNY